MSGVKEGEFLPRLPGPESVEGEFIPAGQGAGTLHDEHSSSTAADEQRGRADAIDLSKIDRDWVMRRLVAEANDFGKRTRQTARIKALELIGSELGMFEGVSDESEHDADRRRAMEMDPVERRQRVLALAEKAGYIPKGVRH